MGIMEFVMKFSRIIITKKLYFGFVISGLIFNSSCYKEIQINNIEISDWSEESHGMLSEPDYNRVFPCDQVNRIDIIIDKDNWNIMLDDMTSKLGAFGGGGMKAKLGPGGPGLETGESPVYVPCSIFFEGKEWYKVGIRFKGNSSLNSVWRMGIWKLPFKLDFDEYDDDFPQINNQRFYGFRQMSLKNGFKDPSLMREKVVGDLLEDAGFAVAKTAFYKVFVDTGEGTEYFGLYTMVEDVDDTVIRKYFENTGGNLYKPQQQGATFSNGSFGTNYFIKHSNEETSDWSDIISLFEAIHSNTRISNTNAWKQELESLFNVELFLNWLAINTTIQNWDTYGVMFHNYYLYNNPADNTLSWIPWDNNEALLDNEMGQKPLSFSFEELDDEWPLIRYLYDNADYREKYDKNIRVFINEIFIPVRMRIKYQEAFNMIKDYVVGPDGERENYTILNNDDEFYQELQYLKDHVETRNIDARDYLNN